MAQAGKPRGDRHNPQAKATQLFEEPARHFADEHDALEGMPGRENPAKLPGVKLIFRAKEHGGELARLDAGVEPMLHVTEIHARRVQPQRRAEDDAHLTRLRRRRRCKVHSLGPITTLHRVRPYSVVRLRVDAVPAAVQHERNERLRYAELVRELGLGDFL